MNRGAWRATVHPQGRKESDMTEQLDTHKHLDVVKGPWFLESSRRVRILSEKHFCRLIKWICLSCRARQGKCEVRPTLDLYLGGLVGIWPLLSSCGCSYRMQDGVAGVLLTLLWKLALPHLLNTSLLCTLGEGVGEGNKGWSKASLAHHPLPCWSTGNWLAWVFPFLAHRSVCSAMSRGSAGLKQWWMIYLVKCIWVPKRC